MAKHTDPQDFTGVPTEGLQVELDLLDDALTFQVGNCLQGKISREDYQDYLQANTDQVDAILTVLDDRGEVQLEAADIAAMCEPAKPFWVK